MRRNLFVKAAPAAVKTKNETRNEKHRRMPSYIQIILHLTMWGTLEELPFQLAKCRL